MTSDIMGGGGPGPKSAARGCMAVASSQNAHVTREMLEVLRSGGTAADAAIAGSLLHGVLDLYATNHGGSLSCLYWQAATGTAHYLNGLGTIPADLPALRPYPADPSNVLLAIPPAAAIPGFMPALSRLHQRFGKQEWARLCEPALRWAGTGFPMSSIQYSALGWELQLLARLPEGRGLFLRNGYLPAVGETFENPDLHKTLQALAAEGPAHFTHGGWAQAFVKASNRLGWPVQMRHLEESDAEWCEPVRYSLPGGVEIIQPPPPEAASVVTAQYLGIMRRVVAATGSTSPMDPEILYCSARALRFASTELGLINDPRAFEVPYEMLLDDAYHERAAQLILRSRPKADLTAHVRSTTGLVALASAGVLDAPVKPSGSCELCVVDQYGNWIQLLNTFQGGGFPGLVVGGVPMVGSHALLGHLTAGMAAWLVPGTRARCLVGNTFVLRGGQPWMSLGTPGRPIDTVPAVLSAMLNFNSTPEEAIGLPRMQPLMDDMSLAVEAGYPPEQLSGLMRRGIRPIVRMRSGLNGLVQLAQRERAGSLSAFTDERGQGLAAGLQS